MPPMPDGTDPGAMLAWMNEIGAIHRARLAGNPYEIDVNETEPSLTDVPVILVSDWETVPPITTKYILGKHELETNTAVSALRALRRHPGQGRIDWIRKNPDGKPMLELAVLTHY